jgi:anti-sigma factor RsiW
MSSRPITEDELHAFVDDGLDPARRVAVSDYLLAHPEEAKRIEGYRAQREVLRAALAPIAEEPLPPELNLPRMIEGRRRSTAVWRMAAAAALLVCVGGAGGWSLHAVTEPGRRGIPALAREATDSYEVYASDRIRPVELRANDQPALVQWASERVGRRVTVPDLSASGYRFMGGRVVATSHGPAVLFMYDDDHGVRLVLLSRPMALSENAPMAPHSHGSVRGFTWADNGVGYSLVGPAAPEVLHPLADEVRRQVSTSL